MDTSGLRRESHEPTAPDINSHEYVSMVLPRASAIHTVHPPPQQKMYDERAHGTYAANDNTSVITPPVTTATTPAQTPNPVHSSQDVVTFVLAPHILIAGAALAAAAALVVLTRSIK